MTMLRWKFDVEKLISAIGYLSTAGVRELSKLKLAKLLFFADKEHLIRHGRPILGDEYFALDYGPVPSKSLDLLDGAAADEAFSDREHFDQYLEITPGKYPEFRARTEPDLDVLSESEVEVLEQIGCTYGAMSPSQLVKITHDDPSWKKADRDRSPYGRERMPYEDFFSENPKMLELARAEQENRDFERSFFRV